MTVRTSVVPDVIDYLVTTFRASNALGAATPPVVVYDGPVTTAAPAQLVLWVGISNPDTSATPIAAESEESWVGLGARQRDELLTIYCTAEAWAGTSDVQSMRQAVYGIVSAVEAILQADATLGGLVLFTDPTASARQLRQNNTSDGQIARVMFQIKAKARIGGIP